MIHKDLSHFSFTGDSCSIRKSYSQKNEMRDYLFQFNGSMSHKFIELSEILQADSTDDFLNIFEMLFEFGLNELIEILNKNDKNGKIDREKLFVELPELKANLIYY